jgi:hypothetical protein
MDRFMSKGVLTGSVQLKPTLLCTGTSTGSSALWQKFGWVSQILGVDSTTSNGFKGAVLNRQRRSWNPLSVVKHARF